MLALAQFVLLARHLQRYNPASSCCGPSIRLFSPDDWITTILTKEGPDSMLDVPSILALHQQSVIDWHLDARKMDHLAGPGIQSLIAEQHAFNFRLWHEEDQARCPNASDHEIARVKRAIDKLNQQRNDWIERIDLWILQDLQSKGIESAEQAPQNTETPGSAVDRLSIMALRIYHLNEQKNRDDAPSDLLESIVEKIERCQRQLKDLSQSLTELLDDIYAGRKRHQLYCQMKMYNDPRLNPYLVAAEKQMAG